MNFENRPYSLKQQTKHHFLSKLTHIWYSASKNNNLTHMLRVFENIDFWPTGAYGPVRKFSNVDLWIYASERDAGPAQ